MRFDMQMTIGELVHEMNNGGNQSELYKLSKINKDVIPYLFRAGGYIREKQQYIATNDTLNITIEKLLPLAKDLHQQTKLEKLQANSDPIQKAVVINKGAKVRTAHVKTNVNELGFNFSNKLEMQNAILDVLDLTIADLETLRALKDNKPTPATETIYDAISKLQGRKRVNKTYYISEEIAQQVQEFTESHAIKTSQFVEIALLEAIRKYEG